MGMDEILRKVRSDANSDNITENEVIKSFVECCKQAKTEGCFSIEEIFSNDNFHFSEHSRRVSDMLVKFGRVCYQSIGLFKIDDEGLKTVGLMHDIGKIVIPDYILEKNGPLSADEWIVIKRHPSNGARILGELGFSQDVYDAAYYHQVHYDKKGGYPLVSNDLSIPLIAQMTSIVDCFDAISYPRWYDKRVSNPPSMNYKRAIEELEKGKGKQFNYELVSLFKEEIFNKSLVTI